MYGCCPTFLLQLRLLKLVQLATPSLYWYQSEYYTNVLNQSSSLIRIGVYSVPLLCKHSHVPCLFCARYIYFVHSKLILCTVYLFCAQYNYFVHPILILCTVNLFCAQYTYIVHSILILCTAYLFCAQYTYFVHSILILCTV